LLTARRLLTLQLGEAETIEPGGGGSELALDIQGTEGLMLTYARCCYPIPGDPIFGHISAGRGIVVHREECKNIAEFRNDPERSCALRWADKPEGEFDVELKIELQNRRGILAVLANKISSLDVNIEKITTEDKDADVSLVRLVIEVRDRVHLARIIRRIRTIKSVYRVSRVRR
jgi:(p)ppGpp synthase/HD superfamily hydrolase